MKHEPENTEADDVLENEELETEVTEADDEETTPVLEMNTALKTAIAKILDSEELDNDSKLSELKTLIDSVSIPVDESDDEDDFGEGLDEDEDAEDVSEILDNTVCRESILRNRVNELESREQVRHLFESAGVLYPSSEDVRIAAKLTGDDRLNYIHRVCRIHEADQTTTPRSSGGGSSSQPEGFPSDSKGFLQALGR